MAASAQRLSQTCLVSACKGKYRCAKYTTVVKPANKQPHLHCPFNKTRVKESFTHGFRRASGVGPFVQLMNGSVRHRMTAMLLNGWKEISNYVQRGVRTVQRWEHLGLPVMRINQGVRSPTIARSEDIDQWLTRHGKRDPQPLALSELAEARRAQLQKKVEALMRRHAELIRAAEQITTHRLNRRC